MGSASKIVPVGDSVGDRGGHDVGIGVEDRVGSTICDCVGDDVRVSTEDCV